MNSRDLTGPGDRLTGPSHGRAGVHGRQIKAALARFDRQFCLGETNLVGGFEDVAALFDVHSPRRRLVVYIGDGEETSSELSPAWLRPKLAQALERAKAALLGVLVRESRDGRELLESVARTSGGLLFDLAGDALGQPDLAAWLASGLPTPEKIVGVEVEGADAKDLFFPTVWLPGRTLHVFGRTWPAKKLRVRLTTVREGKPVERNWEPAVDEKQDDVFVGRLWRSEGSTSCGGTI